MSRMKGSSFFCEDLRTEESGQPMFIGVISPVFEFLRASDVMRRVFFVSFFYPEPEHLDIEITLNITISHSDSKEEISIGPLLRKVADEISEGDEDSMIIGVLPLEDVNIRPGSKVTARLEYGGEEEEYTLKAKFSE
jgi:hypothetical protein